MITTTLKLCYKGNGDILKTISRKRPSNRFKIENAQSFFTSQNMCRRVRSEPRWPGVYPRNPRRIISADDDDFENPYITIFGRIRGRITGIKKRDSILEDERWVHAFMSIIKVLVIIYDLITFPIYYFVQKPWLRLEASRQVQSVSLSGKPEGPYSHVNSLNPLKLTIDSKINTLFELYKQLTIQHGNKVCLGTRAILAEEDEKQPNGRIFQKLVLGNYSWESFNQVLRRVISFSQGLKHLGQNKDINIVLFAETRAEWLVAALACFRYNIPVVTLYANLGEEALIHGINETEATLVITSHELLPKFKTLLSKTPKVQNIIFMEGFRKENLDGYPTQVQISTFNEIETLGRQNSEAGNDQAVATKDDTAIIMYTSGSTGLPKGVIITHRNLMESITSFSSVVDVKASDVYLAYLPLAHVLELSAEFLCILNGVPIGYSSPQTITDASPKIKRGSSGDATILKPSFMASVPLILDRIYKTVVDKTSEGSLFAKELFHYAYNYKLNNIRNGYSTPIADFVVFRKIKNVMGGNLRLMVTGGAPLNPDTHDFIRVCMCAPLLQGYGLTETCACATVMYVCDQSTGRVGAPMLCSSIMLEDWEEGNYRVTDKPYPRGEILIGGEHVSTGYYKLPDKTNEDFFEAQGLRWFRTGDIGEIHPDGVFKIIDRKKDLVKLQFGEYVSLGKVESELKMVNLVENICVYGDSLKLYTVALISPNVKLLEQLGKQLGKENMSVEQLCKDPDVEKAVTKMVQECGKKAKLMKFEIPERVKLVTETWLPDSGLVTAAYKIKRKNIQDYYQNLIDEMYAS